MCTVLSCNTDIINVEIVFSQIEYIFNFITIITYKLFDFFFVVKHM